MRLEGYWLAGEDERQAATAHDERAQQRRDIGLHDTGEGDCAGHAAVVRGNP